MPGLTFALGKTIHLENHTRSDSFVLEYADMEDSSSRSGSLGTSALYNTAGFLLLCFLLFQGFVLFQMRKDFSNFKKTTEVNINTLMQFDGQTEQALTETTQRLVDISDILSEEQLQRGELSESLMDYQRKVGRLSGTVETLEKLTSTDPELLQKYSKVFFLNEHYRPVDVIKIPKKYTIDNGKEVSIHADVWDFLEKLLEDAHDDGIDIRVLSGYRSFAEQATLKGDYLVQFGTGANRFSADQGYSEHQLGTTVDFTTSVIGENLDAFEGTEAFTWLQKQAYRYGFTMSYPQNNEYYEYEPWHWRFVGRDLARYLHREEKHFYDLEQRKIDEYIPSLFD